MIIKFDRLKFSKFNSIEYEQKSSVVQKTLALIKCILVKDS